MLSRALVVRKSAAIAWEVSETYSATYWLEYFFCFRVPTSEFIYVVYLLANIFLIEAIESNNRIAMSN